MKEITFQTIQEWQLFKQLAIGQNFTEPQTYALPMTIQCDSTFAESIGF